MRCSCVRGCVIKIDDDTHHIPTPLQVVAVQSEARVRLGVERHVIVAVLDELDVRTKKVGQQFE